MQCHVDVKSLNRIALLFIYRCNQYAYTNANQLSINCDTLIDDLDMKKNGFP